MGGARQERLAAINIASWLEAEIQQTQGYTFLQQSYKVSELVPTLSSRILDRLNNTSWLESEIRKQLGHKSFQQPDKIAGAIKHISGKELWKEVADQMNKPVKDITQELNSIVDRRNKIAHEADIDPTFNIGSRWNIDEVLVSDAVDFIEMLVESIHQVL